MEGLMLNDAGTVAECTGDTVFIVKNGVIITPKITDGALDGITRGVIFDLCQKLEIEIIEDTLTRYDVYTADEVFLTGTAAEVIPVVKVDDRPIGNSEPGEIFKQLLAAFRQEAGSTGTEI